MTKKIHQIKRMVKSGIKGWAV